jgi:hypothetical protein
MVITEQEVDKMLALMASNVLELQKGIDFAGGHSSTLRLEMPLQEALIALARNNLHLTVEYKS